MNDVLSPARFPKLFKRAKVITIPPIRPISLLSVMYKLLERLILRRIQPLIEATNPVLQAGFRRHWNRFSTSTKEWSSIRWPVRSIWHCIERRTYVGVEDHPLCKISNPLNNMLSNHYFQVFLGNQSSRWRQLKDGLPQGSILAPILSNLYMSDLPSSSLNLFQ
jgi:hypothetical protein